MFTAPQKCSLIYGLLGLRLFWRESIPPGSNTLCDSLEHREQSCGSTVWFPTYPLHHCFSLHYLTRPPPPRAGNLAYSSFPFHTYQPPSFTKHYASYSLCLELLTHQYTGLDSAYLNLEFPLRCYLKGYPSQPPN